uniref:Nonsense-mediated mRNA decay factor SMG8 n=1 Tax=Timema cristinae TaxID=61476 RepID=A0A7R9CBS8_TIMCR|nr:unnamed protein product [Timema cristinae]
MKEPPESHGPHDILLTAVYWVTQFVADYSAKSCKSAAIEAFPGRQIFQTSLLDDPTVDPEMLCDIEGYYDTKQKVIYLHLRGVFDVHTLVKTFDQVSKDLDEKGYLCVWAEIKHKYARALMFLFIVSHVLVLSHPTHSFDISYIYLFRALDATRQKVQNSVMDQLRSVVGIPKEWISAGRPCAPRVLFLFETCPAPFRDVPVGEKSKVMDMLRNAGATNKSQAAGKPSIKKLEHSLEDQIYHILRKSRVVTNNSSNSLFAIPANQEFVFVNTKVDPTRDRLSHMLYEYHSLRNITLDHEQASSNCVQVPQASLWFDVAGKLFSLFMTEGKLKQGLTTLRNLLDTDIKFSEGRCGKVLPLATASYQENLPPHYTRDYHERKLAHAVSVFAVHARGPLFEQYVTQLERECDKHWKNGRQMCELPMMEHSSGVRYVAACNCGRKQGPREDPFTVRGANYEYYQLLAEDCGCCDLETIRFPVFQPSTQDFKAAQLFSNINKTMHSNSLWSPCSCVIPDDDCCVCTDKALLRQPSTTEYLPGMLHVDSPSGLLPQFPSWSLICLGPSSLYSHNLGLQDQQQAGLLGGSAYLLPWDVTIFIGVEYECPRGHRFMCSAPDKVLKTTGSGLVKDNGNKVTGSDMPLYFPCPCRNAKPLVAQLMRIHVVTPKAPIHVTLNPKVQPAPAPCPVFITGFEQPIRLSQSAYWVLRLPYVYVGDHGPYVTPKEPVPLNYGRLLAGMYSITEVAPEENCNTHDRYSTTVDITI